MSSQIAFDFEALEDLPVYAGRAPLHFTTEYFTVAELDEAREYVKVARKREEWPYRTGRHMWGPTYSGAHYDLDHHDLTCLDVDLRCGCYMVPPYGNGTRRCFCGGDIIMRTICEQHRWHFDGLEAEAIVAWHDHAWPGWRDLPIVPLTFKHRNDNHKLTKQFNAWVDEHYPDEWKTLGAPIITERESELARRSVPGYSPWGGYSIPNTALTLEVSS